MEYIKTGDTYIVRMDRGEEIIEQLTELIGKEHIRLAKVEAIGACDYIKVGLYNVSEQKYHSHEFEGAMEITSLLGNITEKDGAPYIHLHINAGDEECHVIGGHLNACRIAATCEMFVTVLEGSVDRRVDERIGLNVFKF